MNCLCCTKEPDYYTLLETNISQFCIICSEKIKKLLVYCRHCQGTIGHISCFEKWNKIHKKCPRCHHEYDNK